MNEPTLTSQILICLFLNKYPIDQIHSYITTPELCNNQFVKDVILSVKQMTNIDTTNVYSFLSLGTNDKLHPIAEIFTRLYSLSKNNQDKCIKFISFNINCPIIPKTCFECCLLIHDMACASNYYETIDTLLDYYGSNKITFRKSFKCPFTCHHTTFEENHKRIVDLNFERNSNVIDINNYNKHDIQEIIY